MPEDFYPVYNRGRAHLALGSMDLAKEDFQLVADQNRQPKARKLAQAALAEMK